MISFTMDKWARHPEADDISLYVQELGGYMEIHRNTIEFYIPQEYHRNFIIKISYIRGDFLYPTGGKTGQLIM